MLSDHEIRVLLGRLCVELGFCLAPAANDRLVADPPADAESFTDAVFRAEGMNPELADRHLYRQVKAMVAQAFHDAASRTEA